MMPISFFFLFCKNYINQNLNVFSFSGFIQDWMALHWGTVIYNFCYFLQIIDYYLNQEVYILLWYIIMLYNAYIHVRQAESRDNA